MPRADLSKHLVHWTKGADYESAFCAFRRIVFEGRIRGSSTFIRGGWTCVCFTEAPEVMFHQVSGKYKPFGVQVPKAWLFGLGGRPVIYQTDDEYELLPDELKWRHVRYEPHVDPPFDFSWEREWRIRVNELALDPLYARLILPNEMWARALIDEHEQNEGEYLELLVSEYGEEYRMYSARPFAFTYSVIGVSP